MLIKTPEHANPRSENRLVWTPIIDYIQERMDDHGALLLAISPFIKLDALKLLIEKCEDTSAMQVVVRWQPIDIVTGVSDLEIFDWLDSRGIPLYRHPDIHLKLLVFSRNWAFHTSGNITRRGLGVADDSNIEVGAQIRLELEDWVQIETLISGARRVDSELLRLLQDYLDTNSDTVDELPPLELPKPANLSFSRASLPACESPESLLRSYVTPDLHATVDASAFPAVAHDLALYGVPIGLAPDEVHERLRAGFRSHPFVAAIIDEIRHAGSLRFGTVNAWITEHCSDRPTPYKWELKQVTSRLYNWLSYFYEEITWDRPNYSQIIRWKD